MVNRKYYKKALFNRKNIVGTLTMLNAVLILGQKYLLVTKNILPKTLTNEFIAQKCCSFKPSGSIIHSCFMGNGVVHLKIE